MKKIFGLVFLFVFHEIALVAQIESNSFLLWKISGKNLKEPGYVFGTIHIQDERVFFLEGKVKGYINQCDAFGLEVLIDEVTPENIQKHLLMKKKTLKDLLTVDEYEQIDHFLKLRTGVGVFFFSRMKPFFLATQIAQLGLAKDRDLPLDLELLKYARDNNKMVFGIEKFEDQIRAVDKISLEEQTKMLLHSLEDSARENMAIQKIIDAYLSQEIEQLFRLTLSDAASEKFVRIFINERNKRMTSKIIKTLKKQSAFFAVGAAHLGGPGGIIYLLRKKGYTVEPVP